MKTNMQSPISFRQGYAGLYIHFPFCIQKCDYCDFYSIGVGTQRLPEEQDIFPLYLREIQERIRIYPQWKEYTFDTVFFGGGTPSRMDPRKLEDFLAALKAILTFSSDVEITLESNPEDLTPANLKAWSCLGIHRVNVGYQTRQRRHLDRVGRYYNKKVYREAPEILALSPISRYGFDLIYGFPGQTLQEFYEDLEFLLGFSPHHMSLYSLTLEKGTKYARDVREGRNKPPEENLQEEIFRILPRFMKERGWEWYEVSNFCRPGYRSRHNLKYWTLEPYLGIGPSASGFTGSHRYTNPRNLNLYWVSPTVAPLEPSDPFLELGIGILRLLLPVDWGSFFPILEPEQRESLGKLFRKWADQNLAHWDLDRLVFQWNESGILFLEDRILEFAEIGKD